MKNNYPQKRITKFGYKLILPSLLTLGLAVNIQAQNWTIKGSAGFTTGGSTNNKMVLDSNGDIIVGYADQTFTNSLSARTFDGTNWNLIGVDGFTTSIPGAQYFDLAIDGNDVPYAVYRADASASYKAAVKKFDGSAWVQVGVNGISPASAQYMDIAIDASNNPYICFKDQVSTKLNVMKFDGSTWATVCLPDFSAGEVYGTAIAFDNTNTPYVAFRDVAAGNKATVMKYDGSAWVNVGAAGFSAGAMSAVDLAIDNTGKPYVIFVDNTVASKATVMSFDGTSWQLVGTAGISTGQAWNPDIVIDQNNVPYVGFRDDGVSSKAVCKMFNGTSWVLMGANGFSANLANNVSLAVAPNGIIYSFFRDNSVSGRGTVMEFCESGNTINASNCTAYTSPSGLYTWTSTGTYTDTLTNSKGCDSIITVNLSITGSDLSVSSYYSHTCIGDTNVVYATMSGSPTFIWDNGLGLGSQHTISPTANTTYQVIANDGAGCIDTAELTIPVYTKPNLVLTQSDTIVCQGDSVFVTNSGAFSYDWSYPLIDTLQSQWFVPPYTSQYHIYGYDNLFNCFTLDSIFVEIDLGPSPGTGFSGTLMYLNGNNFTTQWYYNGSPIAGANGYDYTATQNGTYEVVMTDSIGCSSTESWNVVGLSIEEMIAKDALVYPVPFESNFTISTSTFTVAEIYAMTGQKLFEVPIINQNTKIEMEDYPSGAYLLFLSNSQEVVQQKIIKK